MIATYVWSLPQTNVESVGFSSINGRDLCVEFAAAKLRIEALFINQ